MQFRRLVAAVACGAMLSGLTACTAAEFPTIQRESKQPAAGHCDGWRAARRTESSRENDSQLPHSTSSIAGAECTTDNDPELGTTRILAQGPDEDIDLAPPLGPTWSYPSRRQTTSVAVPGYEREIDASRVRAHPGPLALRPSGRRAVGTSAIPSSTSPASYPYQSPAYDSSPPPLPSFHATPFQRAAPVPPADPYSCAPCQPTPFDDPCARLYDGGYKYTWDDIYFFALFDAFRLANENTRAGGRFGLNWGLPVIDDESGLGFQIGFSGSLVEEGPQWFVSSGLFYRGDMRLDSALNVGGVFDWMHDDEIDIGTGQVRAMSSITLDRKNEIGVWGAISVIDDNDKRGHMAESVNQANLFYRYLFDSSWDVSVWVGWRSEPESAALGAAWYAPINDYWAGVFGGYYAFEGDTWNVYTGFVRHWGNRARQDYIGQDRHLPYLPVADNSTMTLFHKR